MSGVLVHRSNLSRATQESSALTQRNGRIFVFSPLPPVLALKAIPDIRVVAFATPACADIGVSKLCESVCTSVVLHDDVVPRVTPHAVRALLKDLLCTKVGWWPRDSGRGAISDADL